MLGAGEFADTNYLLGMDVDEMALEICRENFEDYANEGGAIFDLLQADVTTLPKRFPHLCGKFDVVVSNPPFGTKNNTGG